MISNLAFALPENLSLKNLPRGEFKFGHSPSSLKCSLDIVCRTCESNNHIPPDYQNPGHHSRYCSERKHPYA